MMSVSSRVRRFLESLRSPDRPELPSADLRAEVERFGTWTYPVELPGGIVTPVHVEWLVESHETRARMVFSRLDELYRERWPEITCLDIACNEGFFALEIARRGAKRVVGFDARDVNIEKAKFLKRALGRTRIEFHVESLANLTPERFGIFDLTLCLGLLYHLEDPMDALRRVRAVTGELCIIDTQVLKPAAPVTTAWITDDNLIETNNVIGVIEEADAMVNPAASVTGLSLVMNEPALLTMLRHAGFTNVETVPPFPGCFQPYASGDRLVLLAWV